MPIRSQLVEQLAQSLQASSSSGCGTEIELYYHPSKEEKRQLLQIQVIDGIFQKLLEESHELRRREEQQQRQASASSQSQSSSSPRHSLHRSDIVRLFRQAAQHMHLHVESTIIEDAVDALLEEVASQPTPDTVNLVHATLTQIPSSSSIRLSKKQFRTLFLDHPDLMKCMEHGLPCDTAPYNSWKDGMTEDDTSDQSNNKSDEHPSFVNPNNNNKHGWKRHAQHGMATPSSSWCFISSLARLVTNWCGCRSPALRCNSTTRTRWKNQRTALLWTVLYLSANLACFLYKAYIYVHHRPETTRVFGSCIVVARGSAQCLNLNCALILWPMCRPVLTRLRQRLDCKYNILKGGSCIIFPFDSVVEYHIFIGLAILFFTILHVGAHVCDFHRFSLAPAPDLVNLFGDGKLGTETITIPDGPWDRWIMLLSMPAGITGIIMLLCIIIAYPLTRIRRSHFNTFWWSHQLLLVMLVALCFHGMGSLLEPYQSVYWIMAPLVCYLVPRLLRETPRSNCSVLSVAVQKGNVIRLRLVKPDRWKGNDRILRAGMYAYINIPQVSRLEWHPFTMTSAPSDDYIEFHVRRAGDWTAKVQDLLMDYAAAAGVATTPTAAARSGGTPKDIENGPGDINAVDECRTTTKSKSSPMSYSDLVVKVEGPIGASSQGFSQYPIVVLVGAGIGVAPMISVLKELLANPGKMKRVFLYWTVRDCAAFEWFSALMQDIYHSHHHAAAEKNSNANDHDQQQPVMHIRHFLTSAHRPCDNDIGAVLLHYAKQAKHGKTNFDLWLGQYSHHQADVGRPNWEKELLSVQSQAKELGHGKCGVFLCGPEKMAKTVAKECFRLSKTDRDFHFYFSKEIF